MKTNIGNNIRNLRELKNYTQAYMADLLEMSVSGYGKIERNETEISLSKLKRISEILEVDYSKILDFDKQHFFKDSITSEEHNKIEKVRINSESEISTLVKQLIADNQDFKSFLSQLLSRG